MAAPAPGPAPSQALIEKLGAGDRAYLAGDYRGALFLYQDAAYLDPGSSSARIRLARAYASLRYPDKAEAQLQQVLAQEPGHAEAGKLLQDLRTAPAQPGPAGGVPVPAGGVPPAAPAGAGAAGARVYKFTPEAGPSPAPAPPAPPTRPARAEEPFPPPPPPAAQASDTGPSAADLYRAGVAQVARREFALAVDSFTRALDRDPGLAVAVEARASARFGLGQYREAAQDYQAASDASPGRASPLWGLAECYRLLGDGRAGEAYARYAESGAPDVVEAQRDLARKRANELRAR
jgi:tetratricopeptide (TPR) repeat protein